MILVPSQQRPSYLLAALMAAAFLSRSISAFAPITRPLHQIQHQIQQHQPQRQLQQQLRNHHHVLVLQMAAKGDNGSIMPLPRGSLVALVTPLHADGSLDTDGLRSLLTWHQQQGTNGLVILGTTGEASTLTKDEKIQVMEITRDQVGGVLPIIVGTGTIDTQQTILNTQLAKDHGADAALVVTPYYVKPTQAGLYQHFKAIADAVDLPLVLYNVPGRTGVDLSMETTVKLAHHPRIQGLKDATGDNNRVNPMRTIIGNDFRLYSGEDGMAREYVLQGGDGVISVTANVAPAAVSQVMAAAATGDADAALVVDEPLASLHRDLFCEANPIPVKWALQKMNQVSSGHLRLPLTELNAEFHDRVEAALALARCIEGDRQKADGLLSFGWPSRKILLEGQLFDAGLINEALDIIEKRNGDFEVLSLNVQPNDQFSNADFNFKRPSSATIKVWAVDTAALDHLIERLQSLVEVMESAEGVLTVLPEEDENET